MPKIKEREAVGRILKARQLGQFTLLNDEKLGRALDLLEDIVPPRDAEQTRIVKECKALGEPASILALYDYFGGAVKIKDRKLAFGTFYDFPARQPKAKPTFEEEDFEDEYMLVRKSAKKVKKAEDVRARIKRLEAKAKAEKVK